MAKKKPPARKNPPLKPFQQLTFLAPPTEVTVGAVPEGKIVDFLTGRVVKDTPEEYVRQNLEKAMVRQYRYAPGDCAPEVKIKLGSSKPRVDIIVYKPGSEHRQENAYILIETKKPGTDPTDKKEGIGQLQSYMAGCINAQYGLWTNGDDRVCIVKRPSKDGYEFDSGLLDIPALGESEADAQRPKRKELMAATADNLLFAFRRCHNYIAGTEGVQKPEAFWELLKIIFCKIEDERSGVLNFFVTPSERSNETSAQTAKSRIQKIMADRVVKKYPAIFVGADAEINLKSNVVAYVVSQLQRFSLLASHVDVKGVAYEEVVGSNLRGDRGEFFTPRNACRMAVKMLDPRPGERLLDPACGTGGFLIIAMNHALARIEASEKSEWTSSVPTQAELSELYRKRNEYLSTRVFGLDLNPSLVRAAKMNMVMNNDGEGGLYQAHSLTNPRTWNPEAATKIPLGSIDILFTNPPFGANIVIDGENILGQYDLAARWTPSKDGWEKRTDNENKPVLQTSQPPEILFIERCVQFLKEGTGRMAMVIPNGILNNPALGYVRQWMLRNTQIIAVVDMARELFQPKNDTQTSMVLMRRLSASEREKASVGKLDYPVFMAIAEKIGHDKRRQTIYRQDANGKDVVVKHDEEVVEIDPHTGQTKTKIVQVQDRAIDDELPEVADEFHKWLASLK